AYLLPISLPGAWGNPIVIWTAILLVYCFVASVLPVWLLLQPRDFINSHQLVVALVILVAGLAVAGWTGQADIAQSAPAVVAAEDVPDDAPPIFPFLFVTVACGAVSGFHCLVSSGTTSKQLANETDAQYVGYGSMLLESALAVLVICACCAGVGMGKFDRVPDESISGYTYQLPEDGTAVTGRAAWEARYGGKWHAFNLGAKVGAFVDGGANFIHAIGLPLKLAIGIMAVLVASFAATTLDTATRLQRYVIQELATTARIAPLRNKYMATLLAVACGGAMAMMPGPGGVAGTGGKILWPLFGAVNQLLAGLALMVTAFYLWRRSKPVAFVVVPMLAMILMPAWAMLWQLLNPERAWPGRDPSLLQAIGIAILVLQVWMVVEGLLAWKKAKGVLEEALPPLETSHTMDGGRSC
ncbi:MAG: carbon starvation protein A, partial [Planctomycetes bacterium]|nr:carbon starvation protein A [Planctomycetota bacterium]